MPQFPTKELKSRLARETRSIVGTMTKTMPGIMPYPEIETKIEMIVTMTQAILLPVSKILILTARTVVLVSCSLLANKNSLNQKASPINQPDARHAKMPKRSVLTVVEVEEVIVAAAEEGDMEEIVAEIVGEEAVVLAFATLSRRARVTVDLHADSLTPAVGAEVEAATAVEVAEAVPVAMAIEVQEVTAIAEATETQAVVEVVDLVVVAAEVLGSAMPTKEVNVIEALRADSLTIKATKNY